MVCKKNKPNFAIENSTKLLRLNFWHWTWKFFVFCIFSDIVAKYKIHYLHWWLTHSQQTLQRSALLACSNRIEYNNGLKVCQDLQIHQAQLFDHHQRSHRFYSVKQITNTNIFIFSMLVIVMIGYGNCNRSGIQVFFK